MGQETRLPSEGGDRLLFGFCHPPVGAGEEPRQASPPGELDLMGWQRSWALLGTFPSASGVAAAPGAGPEHPTASRNGTNMARRGTSAVGRTGHKSPIMALTTPRVGGGGLKIGDELACDGLAVVPGTRCECPAVSKVQDGGGSCKFDLAAINLSGEGRGLAPGVGCVGGKGFDGSCLPSQERSNPVLRKAL